MISIHTDPLKRVRGITGAFMIHALGKICLISSAFREFTPLWAMTTAVPSSANDPGDGSHASSASTPMIILNFMFSSLTVKVFSLFSKTPAGLANLAGGSNLPIRGEDVVWSQVLRSTETASGERSAPR